MLGGDDQQAAGGAAAGDVADGVLGDAGAESLPRATGESRFRPAEVQFPLSRSDREKSVRGRHECGHPVSA
jgi:hypothetical protein